MSITDKGWIMTAGTGPAEETYPRRAIPPARKSRLAGTPQQEAFYSELIDGSRHVLLEARAGTGKSTSCREGMWRLLERDPRLAIRYCCFNKAIATEFEAKAPPAVDVGTMHQFGFSALKSAFGSALAKDKTYQVLDAMEGGARLKRYVRKSIALLVGHAKNQGVMPDDPELLDRFGDYVFRYDVEMWRQQGEIFRWAQKVLARSAEMTALVDFDDMLWLSVVHAVSFPSIDYLFIDECQDLNRVQHLMAERLCASGRTIVVGDPFQSIYAFRGADSESMPKLRARLDALTMPLTVTFRCPRSHVDLARELVPDLEAREDAPEGELRRGPMDLIDGARVGDLVLCRANAPVIAACLRQIANLVPAIVRGRAFGDELLAIVKKVGDVPTIPAFLRGLSVWKAREIDRLDARDGTDDLIEQVTDKAASLASVAGACDSPSEIPSALNRLFDDQDASTRVTFSSVHRAKGSEAQRVTYIQIPYSEKRDKDRPPQEWELQQRRNLRYVALTRSFDSLTLVADMGNGR